MILLGGKCTKVGFPPVKSYFEAKLGNRARQSPRKEILGMQTPSLVAFMFIKGRIKLMDQLKESISSFKLVLYV